MSPKNGTPLVEEDAPWDGQERLDAELAVPNCQDCPNLVDCRSRIVSGVGPIDADVVLVGEAPGADEDEGGEPFIGRSGDILDEALEAAGMKREDVRITNCVRCRPPDNRDPHVGERENCAAHLWEELARVDPDVVVPLGRIPCEQILGEYASDGFKVSDEVGTFVSVDRGVWSGTVVVSVHPAATLYNRSLRPAFDATFETVSAQLVLEHSES